MNRRAVIFDVDGVLVDSFGAHLEAWRRVAKRIGRTISEDPFAATFGRRNPDIIRTIWPDAVPDDQIEALGDWKEAQYRQILGRHFPAKDGAAELLDALKAAGFALAIGSSGPPENIQAVLEGLGRAHLFDAIVNGTEVAVGKPHPEVFLKAAEKLGIGPRLCAVIEDAPAGIEAARRAGMAPIGLSGTVPRQALEAAGAWQVIESLRDLSPEGIGERIEKNVRGRGA